MTLPQESQNKSFDNYFYNKQIKNYILQFMSIFSSMKIKTGKGSMGSEEFITVPIRYSGANRMIENILAGFTTNKPIRLPLFSARMTHIELSVIEQKGVGSVDRRTFLPTGVSFPDGIKTVYRRVPTPYTLSFELNLYTSNEDQKFQIIEQITSIFDPIIQLQFSDDPFSWMKISMLKLESITFDDTYPVDIGNKVLLCTFGFTTTIWMSVPIDFKDNFIKSISLRISDMNNLSNININYPNPPYDEILNSDNLNLPLN